MSDIIDFATEWEYLRELAIWQAKAFPAYSNESQAKAARALMNSLLAELE